MIYEFSSSVNANPEVFNNVDDCLLNYILNLNQVILALNENVLDSFVKSEKLAKRLINIPHETIAKLIQVKPEFLRKINETSPHQNFIKTLLKNKSFIKKLPKEFLAQVLEFESIRDLTEKDSIKIALEVYPDLPLFLSQEALEFEARFLTDHQFLIQLPCSVFLEAVANPDFIDR